MPGIRKIAILDFDVHHGNGTEACVGAVLPKVAKHTFKTPFSEGVQLFPTFRPWLDADDADNILFARFRASHVKLPTFQALKTPSHMLRLSLAPMRIWQVVGSQFLHSLHARCL